MTAPTSPGVVPADDLRAAIEAYNVVWQDWPDAIDSGNVEWVRHAAMYAAIVTDRANRPSLTEDERGQIRREALEEAARSAQAWRVIPEDFIVPGAMTAEELVIARRTAKGIEDHLRALADRSEPRQEKEGDRG